MSSPNSNVPPAVAVPEVVKKQCHPNSKQVLADWRATCKEIKGNQRVVKKTDPDYQKAKDLFHVKHPAKAKPEKAAAPV